MKKMTKLAAAAAVATVASTSVFAATDGGMGTTSSGNVQVFIEKGYALQISQLTDIDLGIHSDSAAFLAANPLGFVGTPACIYASSPVGYTIQLDSAFPGGATGYQMQGNGEFVEYFPEIVHSIGGFLHGGPGTQGAASGAIPVINGVTASTFVDCGAPGNVNADINVYLDFATFDAVTSGFVYSDTLTLTLVSL